MSGAPAARPLSEWDEGIGPVLWWTDPIVEPPYAGTPLDDDFPAGLKWWTPIEIPTIPNPEPLTERIAVAAAAIRRQAKTDRECGDLWIALQFEGAEEIADLLDEALEALDRQRLDSIPDDLAAALAVLEIEGVRDWIYRVRSNEGEGWSGPRVSAFSAACSTIARYLPPPPNEVRP